MRIEYPSSAKCGRISKFASIWSDNLTFMQRSWGIKFLTDADSQKRVAESPTVVIPNTIVIIFSNNEAVPTIMG